MPIYEYSCQQCGEEFDELVRMNTEDADVACPSCGEHKSQRHMSRVASIVGTGGGGGGLSLGGGGGGCSGGGSGFS